MSAKTTSNPATLMQRIASGYTRLLGSWAWLIPAFLGAIGLASSAVSTKVFLALWGGMAVFAGLGMWALVVLAKVRIPAGWVAAIVLTPFIGEVGMMSFALLLLGAIVYATLFVLHAVLVLLAKVPARSARRVVPVKS